MLVFSLCSLQSWKLDPSDISRYRMDSPSTSREPIAEVEEEEKPRKMTEEEARRKMYEDFPPLMKHGLQLKDQELVRKSTYTDRTKTS